MSSDRYSEIQPPFSRWKDGWLCQVTMANGYYVVSYPGEVPFVITREEWMTLPENRKAASTNRDSMVQVRTISVYAKTTPDSTLGRAARNAALNGEETMLITGDDAVSIGLARTVALSDDECRLLAKILHTFKHNRFSHSQEDLFDKIIKKILSIIA